MEFNEKLEILTQSELKKKDTVWGNEIVTQLTGQAEIEIKILDSKNGPLSIQSHPNSWEMWKILEIEPGSFIIAGLIEEYTQGSNSFNALQNKTIIRFCNVIFPKAGDVYLIPKGLIHALGKGIIALEIKPSINNETIRIYDWDRNREQQLLKTGTRWHDVCDQKEKIIKLN
jgi:mannose-6-phosphate isomerase